MRISPFTLLLFPLWLQAATLFWDFTEPLDVELAESTLVYNHFLGVIHSTLQVSSYNGGAPPLDFSVGDGSHGSFELSRYAEFDDDGDVSGNRIIVDANEFPSLNFTQFQLDSAWTLTSINGPLVIRSLGSVVVEGTINCDGERGEDATFMQAGDGGQAFCGGGDGGDGGGTNEPGGNGADIDGGVTGGRGGNSGGAAVSGGGGGSWHTGVGNLSTDGTNASLAGGQAGDMLTDPAFSILGAGAGGGGGSGTVTEAGAGGGAGGGQVVIHAVGDVTIGSSVDNTIGFILASGGNGGDSNVPGGAGGGGAGGSINIYSAGRITIFNSDVSGASVANKGFGGGNSSGDSGGNGGLGRSFFPTQDFNFVGFYTPSEEAPVNSATATVTYSADIQVAVSRVFDLRNTRATINAIVKSPDSSDFVVELAGSDDSFISDDSGFTTDFSQLTGKRYFKIRVSVTASNLNSPDLLDSVSIDYTPGNSEQFDFTATTCGVIRNSRPPSSGYLIFLFPLLLMLCLRIKKNEFLGRC